MTVTPGAANDIDRLEPLWLHVHAVHQESAPELGPWVDDATTWAKRRELYGHCLSNPDSFLLLAARDERLVGYALVTVEPDGDVLWNDSWVVGDRVAELESIAVLPEEQGRGIGMYLLQVVDEELERRGIDDLVIGAVPGNPAVQFYERRGFTPNWVILSRFASRGVSWRVLSRQDCTQMAPASPRQAADCGHVTRFRGSRWRRSRRDASGQDGTSREPTSSG